MSHASTHSDAQPSTAGVFAWSDLWPANICPSAAGWSEQLLPGVSLLLDETGEESTQWLAVLTGEAVPGRGRVQCLGLCTQVDAQAFQAHVYRHQPRKASWCLETTALQWLQTQIAQWPTWSESDWQVHCQGFGLQDHLTKPLQHWSTGSLRKLGLAAALASGARLTVIEEPVAGLDADSIRYLCQALDSLGERMAGAGQAPRWVVVVHWEPLPGVTWDEVLAPPSLEQAQTSMRLEAQAAADSQNNYVQQMLL